MATLSVQIVARAPLAFPERKPGIQFNASLPYVPGPAIYGALGQQLGPAGFDEALFRDLRCSNAYPYQTSDTWVRPLPATAVKPKGVSLDRDGDAQGDTSDRAREPRDDSIRDALIERVCWEQQEPVALLYAPTDTEGRPWEAAGAAFYTLTARGALVTREVQQRVLTRVAIDRRRGTAQDGRIYSPLVISEVDQRRQAPTTFLGRLVVPDVHQDALRNALEAITHLGARQTTGLGAVTITSPSAETLDDDTTVLKRIRTLTERFQQQARLYEALGGNPWPIADGSLFTITLLSDAILLEDGWIPTQELSPALLKDATGIEARLVRSFTTTKTVGGWHSLWQRQKPADVAVVMGGVYLFQAAEELTGEQCARLAELQLSGIGERRAEGFGQLRVCDEFHLNRWGEQR